MALQANVMAPVGFIIHPSRSVAVSDGDAIHNCLDSCALADDLDIVPNVLIVGMKPFPALGSVFRLCVGWPPHIRPQPDLGFPRLVVNESTTPGTGRVDVHLGTIEPTGLVVVATANLNAAVTTARCVGLDLEQKAEDPSHPEG